VGSARHTRGGPVEVENAQRHQRAMDGAPDPPSHSSGGEERRSSLPHDDDERSRLRQFLLGSIRASTAQSYQQHVNAWKRYLASLDGGESLLKDPFMMDPGLHNDVKARRLALFAAYLMAEGFPSKKVSTYLTGMRTMFGVEGAPTEYFDSDIVTRARRVRAMEGRVVRTPHARAAFEGTGLPVPPFLVFSLCDQHRLQRDTLFISKPALTCIAIRYALNLGADQASIQQLLRG
jgi:hypothetical protein